MHYFLIALLWEYLIKDKGATLMRRKERVTYWQSIINQYRDSGLSGAAFCKEQNINPGRFYYWRQRLTNNNHCNDSSGGFFELIPCTSASTSTMIHIQLPNGIIIKVDRSFDPVILRGVIEAVVSIKP